MRSGGGTSELTCCKPGGFSQGLRPPGLRQLSKPSSCMQSRRAPLTCSQTTLDSRPQHRNHPRLPDWSEMNRDDPNEEQLMNFAFTGVAVKHLFRPARTFNRGTCRLNFLCKARPRATTLSNMRKTQPGNRRLRARLLGPRFASPWAAGAD